MLKSRGEKPTKIAHAIGYTTTRQLYNSVEGKSLLSTKAVKGLIENLNVNPFYLFLGKGEMFMSEVSEIETLRKENQELIKKYNEAIDGVKALNESKKQLEKKNLDLIEMSMAAIKYFKSQVNKPQETEEITKGDVIEVLLSQGLIVNLKDE